MARRKKQPDRGEQAIAGEQADGGFDGSDAIDDESIEETIVASDEAPDSIEELQAERDEAVEARQRALADLVNFRRRADENIIRARHAGIVAVMRSLLPVLDNVSLTLGHEEDEITVDQLTAGFRMVQDELLKTLDGHAVRVIRPEVGDEFDPNWHQAVMRTQTNEIEPGAVACVHQIGYAIAETMLRPASVSVAARVEETNVDENTSDEAEG